MPLSQAGRFPVLDAAQLEVLRTYGTDHEVAAGDVLFAEGEETYDLIVVFDGELEIIENRGRAAETVLATYGPRHFVGEISLLTGQRTYLAAGVRTAGRVLRVPVAQVRVIMAEEPLLSELLLRTFLLRHANLTHLGSGLTLIGSRFDADTRRILEVLARNRLSSRWLDLEGLPDAEAMLHELDVPVEALPIVVVPGGPSGLSAAVYGASEGLATVLAEDTAFGGQAGTSSRIENYLGFPAGLPGEELAARAVLQAQKFGMRMKLAARAVSLSSEAGVHRVTFEDGEVVAAKALIIATGASYNRLSVDRLADFEGMGVYYPATQMEAQACAGGAVAIVGGGNSAGQATLFLSRTSPQVHVFIGTKPCTPWLGGQLAADADGFLLTGSAIPLSQRDPSGSTPLFLETSRAGIFCVGDVRSGSIKRVAAAVGKGSMAVRLVFDRLPAFGVAVADPLRAAP